MPAGVPIRFMGFVFFPILNFFGWKESSSRAVFFLQHSSLCSPSIRNTLYFSPTPAHPALKSNRHCLLNYEVPSHSLSYSHKPTSPLPSVPFAVFAKRHLSLQAWREDLWPFKQTQALNGLSVCAAVGQGFLYVVNVCVPLCVHMFVFLYVQT